MSDDEDQEMAQAPQREEAIQFGEAVLPSAEARAAGIARGNIERQGADAETLQLPEESSHAAQLQEAAIQDMELRRRMRATIVPTNVKAVQRVLRAMGEPVTLFGERPDERRDRLRKLLADKTEAEQEEILAPVVGLEEPAEAPRQTEKFFTEGGQQLRHARLQIALSSLARAKQRLAAAKRKREAEGLEDAEAAAAVAAAAALQNQASEIGDERPLTGCEFSADGGRLLTASVSGTVKVWQADSLAKQLTVRAHEARVTGVAWHPQAGAGPSSLAFATASADCTACLWAADGKLLHRLAGHTQRLGRTAFHPAGGHLATASFDGTWRLWDCEAGEALLEQEGHSRAVYAVAFHPDGSLAASAGLDAVGRIWDMRTGRSVMVLEGHVRGVLAAAFAPDGRLLATGSEDNAARLWDLRKRACLYTFPAHQSSVSAVRFDPAGGGLLLTASFDRTAKLWSTATCQLARRLAGHEGHVTGADISPADGRTVATVSQDRTIKLWAPDELAEPPAAMQE